MTSTGEASALRDPMIARTQQPPPPIEVRVTVDTMSQACYTHISMSEPQTAEHFLRRLRDTYEAHDLDGLWTFYSHDCAAPRASHRTRSFCSACRVSESIRPREHFRERPSGP